MWASAFVRNAAIPTEKVGQQKLMRLEDIVNAAKESGILTQEFYHALLSQEPYQLPQQKPAIPVQTPKPAPIVPPQREQPQTVRPKIGIDKGYYDRGLVSVRRPRSAQPTQSPQPRYVCETLSPYELPDKFQRPEFKIDFRQMPEGVSLYQHAAELHLSNKDPFAGLEERVAVYHPSAPEFAKEIQHGVVRIVYHTGLNEWGVITGLWKDSRTGKQLTIISVAFRSRTMRLVVDGASQNINPPDEKIWGTSGRGR